MAANLEEINDRLDQLLREVRSLRQAERPSANTHAGRQAFALSTGPTLPA